MARLVARHWDNQRFVQKVSRFLGMDLGKGVVSTQGDPASPMVFNTVVDAVVREVLEVFCGTQEAQHKMGWVAGERNLMF